MIFDRTKNLIGENALEKFLEALKKNNTQLRNLDTEKFLEMFPFFKEYKPQRTIGLNDLIIQKTFICIRATILYRMI